MAQSNTNHDQWSDKLVIINSEAPPPGYSQYPEECPEQWGHFPPQTGDSLEPSGQHPTVAALAVETEPMQSYASHIVLSCFVFCCCMWMFGLIAFVLAVLASDYSGKGRAMEAKKMAKASFWVSITGVIFGTILLVVIIVRIMLAVSEADTSNKYN